MNYCYILQCGDGSYYTGWTNDIKKRYQSHCEGKGAKYTRGRGPFKILLLENFGTKEEAMKREYEIKQMTKQQKEKLIQTEAVMSDKLMGSIFEEK